MNNLILKLYSDRLIFDFFFSVECFLMLKLSEIFMEFSVEWRWWE